jgi:hypothetical protein
MGGTVRQGDQGPIRRARLVGNQSSFRVRRRSVEMSDASRLYLDSNALIYFVERADET